MKLRHINLVARDADALAAFYVQALGCEIRRGPWTLSGAWVGQGNGRPGCSIRAIWLDLPDPGAPFLEIHQHTDTPDMDRPQVHHPGFGHLAFQVPDLAAALERIVQAGGHQLGEIVDFGRPGAPYLIVYTRDPEGNVLELEQPTP